MNFFTDIPQVSGGGGGLPLTGGTLTGNLLFSPDNTLDIGSPDGGTTLERPRTIYVGTSIDVNTATGFDAGDYSVSVAGLQLSYSGATNNSTISSDGSVPGDGLSYLFVNAAAGIMSTGAVAITSAAGVPSSSGPALWTAGPVGTPTSIGLLPPAITTTQKNAMTAVPQGLIVLDSTLNKLCFRDTLGVWQTITSL